MKKHISITVEQDVYEAVRRIALEEQRSVSQVFERAATLIARRNAATSGRALPVSDARVVGAVTRADAYGDRA